eukprot:TRINITY_DN709_c0_g1_i7.p1 TRINITY_DN709_c0_g1~~TRINITY_DN709_c0_g1_i7.p1  ORF type:complete len:150 (+),score=48.25 TRINITY_DN709_c0_g1_i7:143-592(+)
MARSVILFLVLYCLPYIQAQDCCSKKIVTGQVAEDAGLAGTYTFVKDVQGDKDGACFDGCIYSRDGKPGEEYCFQATNNGAEIADQCDAPTGPTAAAGSTAAAAAGTTESSDALRQQAEDAAARVKANNAIIEEDNKRIEKSASNNISY